MAKPASADPRTTITPDSFAVSPDLLGLPLAKPWRRAGAMLVDLIAVAILANAGGVFLAFAAAIALWRASSSGKGGFARTSLRLGAALVLFVGVLNVWSAITDDDDDADTRDAVATALDGQGIDIGLGDWLAVPDMIALTTSQDTTEVRRAARNVAARIGEGDDVEARRAAVSELAGSVADPEAREILRTAVAASAPEEADAGSTPSGDSAVIAYAAALQQGDTVNLRALRSAAAGAVAGDSLERLEARAGQLAQRNERLEEDIEQMEERSSGFTGFIRSIADDLGIGFGWGALYFTAFLALWGGQTPGKRLFGMRVIRLDGKPIGWWIAFERFGSYAASLSTGLLGFAQIIWDRNRQGLHDKAVETVVIRDLPASIRSRGSWQPAGR